MLGAVALLLAVTSLTRPNHPTITAPGPARDISQSAPRLPGVGRANSNTPAAAAAAVIVGQPGAVGGGGVARTRVVARLVQIRAVWPLVIEHWDDRPQPPGLEPPPRTMFAMCFDAGQPWLESRDGATAKVSVVTSVTHSPWGFDFLFPLRYSSKLLVS